MVVYQRIAPRPGLAPSVAADAPRRQRAGHPTRRGRGEGRWCRSRGSNPDAASRRQGILSPRRLPVPPLRHGRSIRRPARRRLRPRASRVDRPERRASAGGQSIPSARPRAAPSRMSASLQRTSARPKARSASRAMRAPARITSSRPCWMPGRRPRSRVGQPLKRAMAASMSASAEDVPVDELGAVLAQAELVGDERRVGAGHADGAARGAAHRRPARRPRSPPRRSARARRSSPARAGRASMKRSVRRTTPTSRLRTNSAGARPARRRRTRCCRRRCRRGRAAPASGGRRARRVPPRKASAPSSSPARTRQGRAKSRSTASRKSPAVGGVAQHAGRHQQRGARARTPRGAARSRRGRRACARRRPASSRRSGRRPDRGARPS